MYMILRYDDYRLNLSESKVVFSNKFIDILKGIDDKVSNELLKLNGQDKPVTQNWISVEPKTNDTVRFLQDAKAQKILDKAVPIFRLNGVKNHLKSSDFKSEKSQGTSLKIFEALNLKFSDVNKATAGEDLIITGEVPSLEYPDKTIISYRGANDPKKIGVIYREGVTEYATMDESPMWREKGNPMKVGRLAKALLVSADVSVKDSELENFVNLYKTRIDRLNDAFTKFDIVSGPDIAKWYHYKKYAVQKSSLGNSCMKAVNPDFFEVYVKNPEVCRMVILYDERGIFKDEKYVSEKIMGRALLWNTRDGKIFMDRVYTAEDSDTKLFIQFADSNNWWHKKYQSSGGTPIICNDVTVNQELYVDLKFKKCNYWPYVDTLSYLSGKQLSTSSDNYEYELSQTDGGLEDSDYYDDDDD